MKRRLFSTILLADAVAGADAAAAPIRVSDVWSRPATGTAVVYATIHNDSGQPDRLIGATSPDATHDIVAVPASPFSFDITSMLRSADLNLFARRFHTQ